MSETPYRDEQRLALAVTRFIEEVPCRLPHARLEPMMPYEDEDFTLAVCVPTGTDEEMALDQCLAASGIIEDEMEIYILPRVRVESVSLLGWHADSWREDVLGLQISRRTVYSFRTQRMEGLPSFRFPIARWTTL